MQECAQLSQMKDAADDPLTWAFWWVGLQEPQVVLLQGDAVKGQVEVGPLPAAGKDQVGVPVGAGVMAQAGVPVAVGVKAQVVVRVGVQEGLRGRRHPPHCLQV